MVRELSNLQLDKHYQHEPRYGGAVSKDLLPALGGKAWIVNMQNSVDQYGRQLPGDHWVLVYDCRPRYVYYLDPFGEEPPIAVLNRMLQTGKRVVVSKFREQGLSSNECGYLCSVVLTGLLNGGKWRNVLTKGLKPRRYGENDRYAVREWKRTHV